MPKTRAQWAALQSEADILLFGGAAGSLKSATMLMDAVQEFRNPNFMAVIFRESYPNLQDLIKKAWHLYPNYPYFGEYLGAMALFLYAVSSEPALIRKKWPALPTASVALLLGLGTALGLLWVTGQPMKITFNISALGTATATLREKHESRKSNGEGWPVQHAPGK